jgi:hypothetical protein
VIKFNNRRSAAMMMTSASVLVLAAIAPAAHAQQTEVGAPGQALTAGSVTTLTGSISDGGANSGVAVFSADGDIVTLTGAVIDSRATANLTSFNASLQNGATNPLIVHVLTGSSIQSAQTAIGLNGQAYDVTLDTSAGGSTFAAGGNGSALSVNSNAANVRLINGANSVTSSNIGLFAGANGATGTVVVNSTGGAITAGSYGVSTQSNGGSITIGQGAGVTSAIRVTQNNGIGLSAFANGATPGAITITTGAGGTLDGGMMGVNAFSNGAGAVNVNVGGVIGGITAPTSRGVNATSLGGNVAVNATAAVSGGQNGIYASTTGAGTVTVATNAVTSTSFDAVYLSGQAGNVDYTLNGANTVRGATGVTANATSGNIAIHALNTGSAIIGNTRAVDARTSAGGSVNIDLAGTTTGGVVGLVAGGPGSVTINTAAVSAPNDKAVSATTTTGAINIATTGAISGGQGGIYAVSAGAGSTTISATGTVNGGTLSGIDSRNVGLGSATVGTANQRIGTVTGGSNGIFVASGGDISIYAGTVTGAGRGVLASNQTSGGNFQVNGAVLIDVTGTVTAGNGQGVTVINNGALASNTNTVRAADVNSTGGSAVYSHANGGATSVTAGNITAAYGNNNGWTGVFSESNGGAISISTGTINASYRGVDIESFEAGTGGALTIHTGAVTGYEGIRAVSAGSGGINLGTVDARLGAVTGTNGVGITTQGAGDVNVYVNAVNGAARGIVANSMINGAVVIDAAGTVTSLAGNGINTNNFGTLAGDTITVRAANVVATGGTGILTSANGGATTVTTGSVTANSAGGQDYNGISALSANGGAISVTSTGPITGGLRGVFIQASNAGTGGALSFDSASTVTGKQGVYVTSDGSGPINIGQTTRLGAVTATNGAGVFASGAGAINVATGAVTASGGTGATVNAGGAVTDATIDSGFGIAAVSTGGSVNVNANGLVTGGAAGGVLGQTSGATSGVTITTAGVTAGAGRGIGASTVGGPIAITATGPVSAASFGIQATNAGAGTISILASGPVTSTGANGIAATNTGLGAVTVGAADNRIGAVVANGATGTGITAFGAGDVTVYASSVSGGTRGIVAANQYANPNGKVLIDVTGPVVGLNSWGIIGINNGALNANSLTINTGAVTGTGRTAISAQTVGGDINITTSGAVLSQASQTLSSNSAIFAESDTNGLISVNALGTVNGYDGIYTLSDGAAGGINIVSAAAVTGTNQYGIYGHSGGGNVSIDARGQVSGAIGGVVGTVTGNGAVDLRTAGVTSSNGPAVFGQSGGNVTISTGAVTANGGTAVTYGTARNVADASATSGFGVLGLSTGGNVSLTSTGLVTGGAAGGVLAQTSGQGGIAISTAGVSAGAGRAIQADASGGNISINATGAIFSAQGAGIEATNSGAGAVAILSTGTLSAAANGIDAANTGSGATFVGAPQFRTGAITAGATGIFATSQSDVLVYASAITAGTRGIVAASQGANPNGAVTVDTTGAITAASGFGIVAVNNGALAANTLTVNAVGPIVSTGGSGISAQTVGGDITVRSGAVTANTGANGSWDGIFADGRGDSRVAVTTTGAVTGSFRGIDVSSTGTTARSGVTIAAGGNVTAGNGQIAILSNVNGLGNTTIGTAAGTTLNAVGGTGILASVNTATGANNIAINNQAAIGGAGANRVVNGIAASISGAANSGNIAIDSTGGAIQASNAGILASTNGTGSITIGGTAGIGSAITAPVIGISAVTTSGAVTINTAAGGTIAPGATVGIQAVTQTGAITINQAGAIGATGAGNTVGNGIYANIASGTSAININSSAGIYVSAGTGFQSAGIYAFNGGTGAVNVVSTGVIDPGAYGVVVQGAGPVSYAANGGLVEGGQGVYVASTGNGAVNVTSTAGTTITGLSGVGLQAVSANGPVIVTAGGAVSGATSGIVATSTGSGSTVVTNTGAVTSGSGPAIDVQSGTGGLTLNVGGNVVSATGPAILATSAGGGTINVAAGAVVAGRVDTPTESVILLNTASGTISTINVAQGATVQAVSGSPFTTAIRATGGSVVVNNSGVISGQVDFSALTGNNTGQLAGGAGTTFQTGGLSTFGAGNDTFTNAGQLVTIGTATTFDFRGGANVFNNNGQIFVGSSPITAGGSTFLLSSLTTFNNAGSLNLVNGVTGDSIVAPGASYVATTGARLLIDTAIVPGGRSDFLTVGTSSGVTAVAIRDTSPTGFGAYNPTGIVVVNGTTHAGDFVLDAGSSFYNAGIAGGAIDKPGLFFSKLGVNAAGATVLVSLPKVQAYQFSTLASQAQAAWYETAPRAARQAEVRDQLAAGNGAGGFWVDVQGTHTAREVDRYEPTLAGIQHYDASYGQDLTAATIGIDAVRPMMNGDVVFGASVGYVNSSADFDKQSTSIDMDGWSASAYATFVRGGWFVAGTVGANQLNAEIKAPRLAGFTNADTDITSVGATLEAGFRAPFIMGATIEPTAAVAYVNTSVDDFVAAGSTFAFEDGESLRPSLGARVSGDANIGGSWATRYNISVRAVGEALSENVVTVGSAGPALRVPDQFDNAYGEVKAGITSQSVNGWSVFGDLTGRYSDEARAVGASVGFRLRY